MINYTTPRERLVMLLPGCIDCGASYMAFRAKAESKVIRPGLFMLWSQTFISAIRHTSKLTID